MKKRTRKRHVPKKPVSGQKEPPPIRECCQCGVKSAETDLRIAAFKPPDESTIQWWCDRCIYEVEPRLSLYRHKKPAKRRVRRRPRVRSADE